VQGLARAIAAQGGLLFEQSKATRIEKAPGGYIVHTAGGRVEFKEVVLCCSIDGDGLDKRLSRWVFPILTFIMVTKPLSPELLAQSINTRHAIYDTRFSSDYYRVLPDNRIMWGGRVALKDNPGQVAKWLMGDLLKVYPQLEGKVEAEMAWSGRLCYATHKMPQIGKLDDGYWYCTCFGGHGLVPTTIGGELIASAIAANDQRYNMFKPFGLKDNAMDYGGGAIAPYVAQSVYYWWRLRDMIGF
jgi:gamma-glutamylputrescine oxidase